MELDKSKMIAYLQDNLFMGFVEPAGAEVIKKDAKAYGCEVEDKHEDGYFNVVSEIEITPEDQAAFEGVSAYDY